MTDIVERLRFLASGQDDPQSVALAEAANEIERKFKQVAALIELADMLRLDAARYRWLRERDWFVGPLCIVRDPQIVLQQPYMLGRDCPSRERLDAAIDAAMRG